MKFSKVTLVALFISLGYSVAPLANISHAAGIPATLGVSSWPAGISLTNPQCFTVVSGVCGVTNWASSNIEGIPLTTYNFPLTATVAGIDYQLDAGAITGCNGNNGNSLPGQCSVKVDVGTIGQIFATYKPLPAPPIPACLLAAQNLVANHGFESTLQAGVSTGSNNYWIIGAQGQSKVLHWTADTSTTQSAFKSGSVGGIQISAYEGNKFAVINSFGGTENDGIRAEISPAPTQGAVYVVTARVRALAAPHPDFVSFHFLNSGTQLQSANLVRIVNTSNTGWDLVGGVITANGYFNRMVVQMWGQAPFAAIDDVKVCKIANDKKIKVVATPTPSASISVKPIAPVSPTPKPTSSSAGAAMGPAKP